MLSRTSIRPSRSDSVWIAPRQRGRHAEIVAVTALLIPYNLALPPVECCFGTSSIHAANAPRLRKAASLPIEAWIAVVNGGRIPSS